MQGTTQTLSPNKTYKKLDLGPLSGTKEEILEMSSTLVEIFAKLCSIEELELRHAAFGHTDCESFVAANFDDEEAYLTVEHELSHIFFDSDLNLAEEFRKILVEDMLLQAGFKLTTPSIQHLRQSLESFVHMTWNCLEDHRVRSLWEEIYPGGGWLLGERWKNVAEYCFEDSAKEDLLAYIARTAALGIDTNGAPEAFKLCKPHIDAARALVDKTDKKTCLAITKQLIDSITQTLMDWAKKNNQPIKPSPNNPGENYEENLLKHAKDAGMISQNAKDFGNTPQPRQDSLSKIIQAAGSTKSTEGQGAGDPKHNPMGGKDLVKKSGRQKRVSANDLKHIRRISKMATLASNGNEKAQKEMEDLIEKGTQEMKRKITIAKQELMKGLGTDASPEEADKIEYLNAAKAAGIKAIVVNYKDAPKLPPPTDGSHAVKTELERINMLRKTSLYEEGEELDIEAFIEAKLNEELEDAKIFTDTTKESGLELLVLTDCSGSMNGEGIRMVDQAMSDIQFATKNLKVKCHLWAFSNDLYVFTKPASVKGTGGGGTDLIPALDSALEWARQNKNRGIIMLTDGYPTSCRQRNSTGVPKEDMYNVINEARREGIVLSILCINENVSEWVKCSCGQTSSWLDPVRNPSYKCNNCGNTVKYENRLATEYDNWFGKGNYSVVSSKKEIAKQLPKCARALVLNHLNKYR